MTGPGSSLTNHDYFFVGESGAANQLIVSNGAAVLAGGGFTGIGLDPSASNNSALVTGPNSWLQFSLDFGSRLDLGRFGRSNQLIVANGGKVSGPELTLIGFSSLNNFALITGSNSAWTDVATLDVGQGGAGNRLVLSNGATASVLTNLFIGELTTSTNNRVVVDNSALLVTNTSMTGLLDVRRGTNLLNGGLVEVDRLLVTNKLGWIEFNGGTLITRSTSISNGSPFLMGLSGTTPAVWDVRAGVTNHVINDFLDVGFNVSSCQLLVTNGASLSSSFGGTIGVNVGANSNAVTISGIGSKWDAPGDFDLGFGGSFNRLTINGGGTVLSSNAFIGTTTPSSNNLAIVSGANSVWSNRSTMFVGNLGGGNQLIVSNGALIANAFSAIGSEAESSNNLALITDSGSLWTNSNDFYVGLSGRGNQLFVSNGGILRSANGALGASILSSNNQAFVTDPGSLWSNRLELLVGDGSSGNRLVVSKGGTVFNSNPGTIGNAIGARSNSVLVTDAGSSWLGNDSLYVGSSGAFNQLVVSNGAVVRSADGYLGSNTFSSNNLALVTGTGSLWTNSHELHVGANGIGNQLVISNGASVFTFANKYVGYNDGALSNTAIVTDPGSRWLGNDSLHVGAAGSFNRLVISNSAQVFSGLGTIGSQPAANSNQVLVTGPGSLWTNQLDLTVGDGGIRNLLVVSNGALVASSDGFLGSTAFSSNNIATVTGSGSTWRSVGDLLVGRFGAGNQLVVSNGARVANNVGEIGSSSGTNLALVTGSGSLWSNAGDLFIGRSGSGNQLVVTNGGVLQSASGNFSTSTVASNNTGFVTGPGSIWSNSLNILLGSTGSGNRLVVSNGGVLLNNAGYLAFASTSSNNVAVVTGSGSLWSNTFDLSVGFGGQGNQLFVSNGAVVCAPRGVYLGLSATAPNNRITINGGSLLVSNAWIPSALDIRRGTNLLNAGLIDIQNLLVTNALGFFEFSGGTLRTAGTIVATDASSRSAMARVEQRLSCAAGTHAFSNNLVIANNASLIGNGTVIGTVTVQPGGTLAPGTSIGALSLSNSPVLQGGTIVEISKSGSVLTNDQLQVAGALTYAGSLTITNIGPDALTVGDRFRLFLASSYSGSFSTITLPPLASGFIWTNKLAVDGSLEVTLPSVILTIQRTNNVLTLSWPTNASSYCLETAFDLTPPVSWQPLTHGIVTNASSFVFSLTNNPAIAKQFFRLAFPCSPTPVSLAIQLSNNVVTLSWPSSAFRLETTFNLAPPTSWQTISNGITDSALLQTFTFTNNPAIPKQFFRLAFP